MDYPGRKKFVFLKKVKPVRAVNVRTGSNFIRNTVSDVTGAVVVTKVATSLLSSL
jgi:hypothetical protein